MNTEMKKTVVYSTGDKILNIMKEQDMDIPELSLRCGVREDVLMDILAGIREAPSMKHGNASFIISSTMT